MWQHLQVYFCWRRCKKSSNKKSQSSRAKCTSALAWSNSKIPEVIFLTPPTFFNGGGVKNLFNPNVQNFRNWHHLHVFSTSPPSFFDGGGVKKSSNKKSQSTRAKCTSALAWSVNFKFFSNPNVRNGTSWSLTTLSKKFNLVKFKKFSDPNVWNGTSWSLTTLDFFRAQNGTSWSLVTWSNKKGRALSLARENSAFERAAAASQPNLADDLSSWQDKSSSQRAESQ